MALEINDEVVLTPPVPAATVMLLRDADEGLQVLLMRRHAASGVLGGVHVFPGGKLEDADADPVGLVGAGGDTGALGEDHDGAPLVPHRAGVADQRLDRRPAGAGRPA